MIYPLLVVAGAVFGLATSLAKHGHLLGEPYTSKVLGLTWSWLTLIYLAVWWGRSWRDGFARGQAFVLPAVAAYYANDLREGVYATLTGFDFPAVLIDLVFWTIVGTAASAALALVARVAHRGGWIGLAAALVYPLYLAYLGESTRREESAWPGNQPELIAVSQWVVALGLAAALAVTLRWYVVERRPSAPIPDDTVR